MMSLPMLFFMWGLTTTMTHSIDAFVVVHPSSSLSTGRLSSAVEASDIAAAPPAHLPSHVSEALRKPSKTLTVGMEFSLDEAVGDGDLATLSMQTRKLKASTLWTSSIREAKELAKEQGTARGNFPGPCPIVWNGSVDPLLEDKSLLEAIDAVVLPVGSRDAVSTLSEHEVGVIWKVETLEEMTSVLTQQPADGGVAVPFLLDAGNDNLDTLLETLKADASSSNSSIVIVSMPCMQASNAELSTARDLKPKGVHSILMQKAIVGDAEDVEYCSFAVDGLTKKQSSTFNMSGLTGSTNGHFGGVSSSVAKTWRRNNQQ